MSLLQRVVDDFGGEERFSEAGLSETISWLGEHGYVLHDDRLELEDFVTSVQDGLGELIQDSDEYERLVELNRELAQIMCMVCDIDATVYFQLVHAVVWLKMAYEIFEEVDLIGE